MKTIIILVLVSLLGCADDAMPAVGFDASVDASEVDVSQDMGADTDTDAVGR